VPKGQENNLSGNNSKRRFISQNCFTENGTNSQKGTRFAPSH